MDLINYYRLRKEASSFNKSVAKVLNRFPGLSADKAKAVAMSQRGKQAAKLAAGRAASRGLQAPLGSPANMRDVYYRTAATSPVAGIRQGHARGVNYWTKPSGRLEADALYRELGSSPTGQFGSLIKPLRDTTKF